MSGTTLGLELVNDIRQQTHALAEYTKLVGNETDNNSMKIKDVLENFDVLLNSVTELEKDMKTKFLEVNKVSKKIIDIIETSVDLFYHVQLDLFE